MRINLRSGRAGSGAFMAFGAVCSTQLAGAASVALLDKIGVLELTWLRLVWASIILVALVQPWRHSFTRSTVVRCLLLGMISGALTLSYIVSITLLPMGTATALQFLGPLGIAVFHLQGAAKLWAFVPAVGVLALTEPWRGSSDVAGIFLALSSGILWAGYIIFTQKMADHVDGLNMLAISVPVAAVVATFATGPTGIGNISLDMILIGLMVAILLPVAPFILELLALRRMTTQSFGVLMSLQPAAAVIAGWFFLGQIPRPLALLGICLVVVAGIAAARTGSRRNRQSETITTG